MQDASFRIDIAYSGIKRIGATCCVGGDNQVASWIMDEMRPLFLRYCSKGDVTDVKWAGPDVPGGIRITGPLTLPDDEDANEIFETLHRKVTTVLHSKGLVEEDEFSIQFGLEKYDPSQYGIKPRKIARE
jgi:hypothetical protein